MKRTITERINAMTFDTLTADEFDFLVERALKSVRPAHKGNSKAKAERALVLEAVAKFVAERGSVTCADVEKEFGVGNQKAARLLKDAPGVVKATEAKGKVKATWAIG